VNTSNELTSTPATTYTYDYNGNATSKTDSTGTTNYTWDFENRLTGVTFPGSGGTVNFAYDPFGRRIKKVSSVGTSIYSYDGDNLIEETNSSGSAVARYSQGLNIDEPLAMLRSAATSYYQTDGLGSVTSLSSSAGLLAQTYTFDSFGKQTASSGSLTNPFQYTARESDPETGLYYYRARYYDQASGRFLSEDPIGPLGGTNFYGYVGNDPIDWADLFGLQKCDRKKSCGVKKLGYDVTGTVPRNTRMNMHAEFMNDDTHDPKCCEVKQMISWNQAIAPGMPAPHEGFQPPENQPGNWYEDRFQDGRRYGRRAGNAPGSNGVRLGPGNSYGPDSYDGWDIPGSNVPVPGFILSFRLIVVDVCNGGRPVISTKPIHVDFSR
jgi:RHS repeat-associated protein